MSYDFRSVSKVKKNIFTYLTLTLSFIFLMIDLWSDKQISDTSSDVFRCDLLSKQQSEPQRRWCNTQPSRWPPTSSVCRWGNAGSLTECGPTSVVNNNQNNNKNWLDNLFLFEFKVVENSQHQQWLLYWIISNILNEVWQLKPRIHWQSLQIKHLFINSYIYIIMCWNLSCGVTSDDIISGTFRHSERHIWHIWKLLETVI